MSVPPAHLEKHSKADRKPMSSMPQDFSSTHEQALRDDARISAELRRPTGTTDPFAAAVRATRMPMVITDPRQHDNPVVFANDAFCRLTGYERSEIIGRNCRFLQGPETDRAAVSRIRAAVDEAHSIEIDIRNHRKNGEPFWNRLLMAPVRDREGSIVYFFASQVDVTIERERLAGLETHNAALMAEVSGRLHAQQESEARLRFAAQAGRLGFWELAAGTSALTTSGMFLEHFGHTSDAEFTYKDMLAAIHAADRSGVEEEIERVMADGAEWRLDFRVRRANDAIGWVQLRAQVVQASDGATLRLAGISLDITDRRVAEDELRQTNALIRGILATAPGVLYAKDLDGRMLLANGATLDLIGKPWRDVEGRTDREFLPDTAQGDAVMRNDRTVIEHGETAVVEEQVGADGAGPRTWLSTKTPMRDETGAITGLVGVSIDITARKRAEAELQTLNTSLEARVAERTAERDSAWKNSQDLLCVVDKAGNFRAVNPAWTSILGWPQAEIVGRNHLEFIVPEDHSSSTSALITASNRQLPTYENRLRHKAGGFRWISWVAAPEGDLVYASGRHITAEKESAAALAHAEELLRQSQKMEAVGQLTGGIAHDFNNLLAGISGSLELLQRRVEAGRTENLERYTSSALSACHRAAALTQRLLAFARRQPLDPKRVDANRLVADMEDLLRRTLGPAIDLEMVLAGGLWPTVCDPNQLESAILNLAINARDAMPAGGRLTIETSNAHLDDAYARSQGGEVKPGQYVAISVTDTGHGIPPDIIAKVFDPFFTTKPIGQGTGLGLSMLYGFIKQSEGHVRIYSEPEQGTTFRLYLPRHRGRTLQSDDAATHLTAIPQAEDGETVLVVDDEPTLRMLVTETLQELGYAAVEVADGSAALQVLESGTRVDLLVTDVGLPGMNGRQLAEAARAARPGLRVLFITGYAHNAAIGYGAILDPGMEIITKPFALDALATKIRDMIEAS
jgi:PAS domain S-box-containing protein